MADLDAHVRSQVEGEMVRLRHALERHRAVVGSLELALEEVALGLPPGAVPGEALLSTTREIITGIAKVDALLRVLEASRG